MYKTSKSSPVNHKDEALEMKAGDPVVDIKCSLVDQSCAFMFYHNKYWTV